MIFNVTFVLCKVAICPLLMLNFYLEIIAFSSLVQYTFKIRLKAYEIWQKMGYPNGKSVEY
ncbi:DUF2934 domain-containing protein [Nostoc sp. UCD121]|nr:DUF2934 domain-containing protein [Nostoc sp. UCD121]